MLYKFKSKGPAYGLGYTEGEMIDIDENEKITARCTVPEITKDSKGNVVNTGRNVTVDKSYTVDFLIQNDVIMQASAEDRNKFKEGKDITSLAEARTQKFLAEERAHTGRVSEGLRVKAARV